MAVCGLAGGLQTGQGRGVIAPDLLLSAYAQGVFPMGGMPGGELAWFSPDPRGIIPIRDFHVPHGMKKLLQEAPFEIRVNTAFSRDIRTPRINPDGDLVQFSSGCHIRDDSLVSIRPVAPRGYGSGMQAAWSPAPVREL